MPTITDWLMVVITGVYVIATIAICWANIKSASAAKAELEEMKKQYKEDNRPLVEAEFCYEQRTWYIIRFVNHGRLTAQNFQIDLDEEFIESLPEKAFVSELNRQKGKKGIIGVGQHYDLYIGSNLLRENPNMKPVKGIIHYQSGNQEFQSDLYIDLENYMTFFSSTNDEENLIKAVKKNSEEIKGVKQAILKLTRPSNEENRNA